MTLTMEKNPKNLLHIMRTIKANHNANQDLDQLADKLAEASLVFPPLARQYGNTLAYKLAVRTYNELAQECHAELQQKDAPTRVY